MTDDSKVQPTEKDRLDERYGKWYKVVEKPVYNGDVCFNCGGMTRQTGSCQTCMECGTSNGCG